MPVRGPLAHLDLTVTDLERSVPFYDRLLRHLGFRAAGDDGRTWSVGQGGGTSFEIALQPARGSGRERAHDRYAPGLHHVAFHAASRADVDAAHALLVDMGARVLDAPAEYSGPAYSPGYYAVFAADPDGLKLEIAFIPESNR